MKRPPPTVGLHHVALFTGDLAASEHFYVELLGMEVEWRPDANSVYLTSGSDNLALHRMPSGDFSSRQRLDHIGFVVGTPAAVDDWFRFLAAAGVSMKTEPRSHRDGARSFYCEDPDGTTVQVIFHPPLTGNRR